MSEVLRALSCLFCAQLSGSWSSGDALRHWEDSVPTGFDRGLPAGEWAQGYWDERERGLDRAEATCRPQAYPLEVTKLIYCSRTVPEIEKVGSADTALALSPPWASVVPSCCPH